MSARIGVIGDGAAGTLVVIGLLREAMRRKARIELHWFGDGERARGVAYATTHPWHRLNVPAGSMTLEEASTTFPAWLADHGLDDDQFAPRHAFGDYLGATLDNARHDAGPLVRLVEHRHRVTGCTRDGESVRVHPDRGPATVVDRAVLALGPLPSPPLPGSVGPGPHPRIVADPWQGGLDDTADGETILLVGAGLTMVDVALTLHRHAPAARLVAVSRSGQLPRAHDPDQGTAADPAVNPGDDLDLDSLVAGVEEAAAARPQRWREVVDGLRPVTSQLWRSLSLDDQQRFRDTYARRWENHRHRMAPSVAAEIEQLQQGGTLRVHVGGLHALDLRDDDRLHATVGDPTFGIDVDRVVSCTGAQDDVTASEDPLVRAMLLNGSARPHPNGLGFDTGPDGELDDGPSHRLFTLGVHRRGELYESTAIPEIREQASALVTRLLDEE